jgi:nitric oxide reductase large subunit
MNLFSAFNGSDDDNDDQDVEVALVCPTQTLEGLNDKKDKVEKDNKKDGVYKRAKRKFISETAQFVVSLFVLTVVLGLVVISYFFCPICLFGIMVMSACLCPFLPYFNVPLWTSILLIIMLGMTYTQRPFTFIWK